MKKVNVFVYLAIGAGIGVAGAMLWTQYEPKAQAATADRYEDYVMCTGAVAMGPRAKTDGVWLLDYRSGKLLGTVIDRNRGKIIGWAEVDLVKEFAVAPRANVHFMMSTGQINDSQAALYVAETVSGKFGVYTMGARADGQAGIIIKRHDMVLFRPKKKQ